MYNAYIHKKKSDEQRAQKLKSISVQKFVQNYYIKKQPELLNKYSKRVNDFINKVEHQPIIIKLHPQQKINIKVDHEDRHYLSRKLSMQSSVSKDNSLSSNQLGLNGGENRSFKFKNTQDWTSMFTPWQRLERQKNFQAFKAKFGDPSIAYRSIASQSDYHPNNQYRSRDQRLQINPPMKYTNKPTKQILSKINLKKKKEKHDNKNDLKKSVESKALKNNSSVQSLNGFGDDITQNLTSIHLQSIGDEGNIDQSEVGVMLSKRQLRDKKKNILNKVYFKQIMDLQQNSKQLGTKKLLRNILYKCGVYQKKNKHPATEFQVDELSQLQVVGNT